MSRWIEPQVAAAELRAAVFIDKDGTLVRNVPYNVDPKRIEFMPHAFEALRLFADQGFAIVMVTNQPGIALGRFTRGEYAEMLRELSRRLHDQAGITLAGCFTCVHAPDGEGRPACLCRKPSPGLLKQAAVSLHLDLSKSWMVGDILDDIEAGHRAGCRSVLVDVGNETVWHRSVMRVPDVHCHDLLDAAHRIVAASCMAEQA